ncbi:uncharacterized protein SPPG_03398 [Spizellomyces punctatus DAOM BR117]|uniref:Nucleolar 27S pre-rRNA processing Urb2/Npa2 C-terminal domain-containing protein n=1 Tax=Spizellomyces punctatus (strain DAOM BR117) TaxID=645134 RepID=A0A0L0HL42_SPIPD|nr:uncharacterized protein SPPG_03398 [Spizellomyces punctatus DAOM BR117]KND01600.1 hypothetical protein SPPG_03398 [Spizellomyces punctatus DAOM BR117]|eukprot:XP_016609639.1 hypothetical protein SPPG_03398 [Spizellomyces punctatus DAOM BR117]
MPALSGSDLAPSSAEAVTRTLRSSNESPMQRLSFAQDLWNSKHIFIPGKDELLLDWIVSELFNATKGKSCKFGESPHLNYGHWQFLCTLLDHFTAIKRRYESGGAWTKTGSSKNKVARTPSVKARVGDIFVVVLNDVSDSLSERINKHAPNDLLAIESLTRITCECFRRLTADLNEILRPTLELYVTLTDSAVRFFDIASSSDISIAAASGQFLQIVLYHLQKISQQSPNRKKTFSITVSKLFLPILTLRYSLKTSPAKSSPEGFEHHFEVLVKDLLQHNLFHREHMQEFANVLHHLEGKASVTGAEKAGYPKQFLELLRGSLATGAGVQFRAVLNSLPFIYELFIQSSQELTKRRPLSTEPTFPLFLEFHQTLSDLMKRMLETGTDVSMRTAQNVLDVLVDLLNLVQRSDIYRPTNDETSKKQLQFFEQLNRFFLDLGGTLPSTCHSRIIQGWHCLLLLDYTIIESHLAEVWPFILTPVAAATLQAELFTRELLRTFTKCRRLDYLIEKYLEALRHVQLTRGANVTNQAIFYSTSCLSEFAACIEKLLPAQAIALMQLLRKELEEHCLQPQATGRSAKRQKREKDPARGKSRDFHLSAELPVILLSLLLENAHISQGQQKAFEELIGELQANFIDPVLARCDAGRKLELPETDALLLPALSLKLALLRASPAYWAMHVTTVSIDRMLGLLRRISLSDPKVAYLQNEIVLSHIERIASTTVDPRQDTNCVRMMTDVLSNLSLRAYDLATTWDMRLKSLTSANQIVGSWSMIANHLVPISRLAERSQLEDIVRLLIDSIEKSPIEAVSREGTLIAVTKHLLSSTVFYELKPVRDAFVPVLLQHLGQAVTAGIMSPSSLNSQEISILLDLTNPADAEAKMNAYQRLGELFEDSACAQPHLSPDSLPRVLRLLDTLHTLPTAYFSQTERDMIVGTLLVMERLFYKSLSADTDNLDRRVNGLRLAALTRKIGLRLMLSRQNKLLTFLSPAIMEWYLVSLDQYEQWQDAETTATLSYNDMIVAATYEIQELTCRKLLQRLADTSPKDAGATPGEHVKRLLAFVQDYCPKSYSINRFRPANALAKSITAWTESRPERLHSLNTCCEGLGDAVNDFVERLQAMVCHNLQDFTLDGETMQQDCTEIVNERSCKEAQFAFEVYCHLLRFYKFGGDGAKYSNGLVFLAGLVTGSIRLICDISRTGNRLDGQHKALPHLASLCADFVAAFAANFRDITPAVEANSMRNLVTLMWYIMQINSQDAQSATLESECAKKMTSALSSLVRDTSQKQYTELLACHLDRLEGEPASLAVSIEKNTLPSRYEDTTLLVRCLSLVINGDNREVGRGLVRKELPRILVKLSQIIQVTTSVETALEILQLLTQIVADKFLSLRHSDVALILHSVAAVISTSSPLQTTMPPVTVDATHPESVGPPEALQLFDAVYRLLLGLLRSRKDLVVEVIPCFTGVLKELFACFRIRPRIDAPAPRLNRNSTNSAHKFPSQFETPSLLARYAPLPVTCAENLSRLLVAIGQKALTRKHAAGNRTDGGITMTTMGTSASTTVKPFSKHVPFLLSTIVHIQSSARPFTPAAKSALMEGVYALLDLCGDHGRDAVLAGLDAHGGGRPLFKALVGDWEKYHRFTGKV